MQVNSTQSLILTAPHDRPSARVGAFSASRRGGGNPLGAEPLDVSWTEVDVPEVFAAEVGQSMGSPQQPSAGSGSRISGAWTPAQAYERQATVDSAAKGVYLDVHA
jgi:hypothetical protein